MSRALADSSVRIIEMYRAGERPIDISKKLKMSTKAVNGAIHRAKKAGHIDADIFTPPPRTDKRWFRRIIMAHEVRTGGIEKTISEGNMSKDTAKWLCQQVILGGYLTVSEYLIELAIEEFYRRKENE